MTEWPAGSGNRSNNILFTFGMGSTGGCGTGITLDTTSAAPPLGPAPPTPGGGGTCQSWNETQYSDCEAYRHGSKLNHTTCGGGPHNTLPNLNLADCRTACAAQSTCSTIQWQGEK